MDARNKGNKIPYLWQKKNIGTTREKSTFAVLLHHVLMIILNEKNSFKKNRH